MCLEVKTSNQQVSHFNRAAFGRRSTLAGRFRRGYLMCTSPHRIILHKLIKAPVDLAVGAYHSACSLISPHRMMGSPFSIFGYVKLP